MDTCALVLLVLLLVPWFVETVWGKCVGRRRCGLEPLTIVGFTLELWWCWQPVPRKWGGPLGLGPFDQWTGCSGWVRKSGLTHVPMNQALSQRSTTPSLGQGSSALLKGCLIPMTSVGRIVSGCTRNGFSGSSNSELLGSTADTVHASLSGGLVLFHTLSA